MNRAATAKKRLTSSTLAALAIEKNKGPPTIPSLPYGPDVLSFSPKVEDTTTVDHDLGEGKSQRLASSFLTVNSFVEVCKEEETLAARRRRARIGSRSPRGKKSTS